MTGTAGTAGAEQLTVPSQYPTTSYDKIWTQSVGAGASAPTVAAFGGVNYVFVETSSGAVAVFNAVTGAAGPKLTPPAIAGGSFGAVAAPAPTYYDGRIYAGQANGTLDVYDLNEGGTGVAVPLNPNPGTLTPTEAVTGPPAVGTLADADTNVIVAVVPTNYNTYTVLLGARNEPLKTYLANGALKGYSINRQGRYDLGNIFADLNAVPSLLAYDYNGNIVTGVTANGTAPQDPLFAITTYNNYYTDWDMDFASATAPGNGNSIPVNLNFVSAAPYRELTSSPVPSGVMSAPAIDRHGDYYYTENISVNGTNSYLVGVHNNRLFSGVRLKFRFLIPKTTGVRDADNTDYTPLVGFQFVGAPVIDDQGNVYTAAVNTSTNTATVLCFRGDQPISAVFDPNNLPATLPDLTQATISQADEGGGEDNNIQRGPDTNVGTNTATYGQFLPSAASLSFYNFGTRQGVPSPMEIAGNLSEPQPVVATDTITPGSQPVPLLMRTNLAWYVAPFPVTGAGISGLSQVGSSLFLTDGANLYRLSTTPSVGAGKIVAAAPSGMPIGAGQTGAPPSIGGSIMVINGENGVAALTRQVTVIADSGRILGVDGDGSAVWSVDATTRTDPNTNFATKVAFSHPTALSQFAPNDYLVADTGHNRCVRFDSAGNVRWELTRFQDPNGLMASGQPLTLSQPSSIITRPVGFPTASSLYPGDIGTFYLIADSGNDRVLEVADFVNPTTGLTDGNHVLTWVSHTEDRDGRHYRYGNAAYYHNTLTPSGISIAATVTNTRLGSLAAQAAAPGGLMLGPVSGDAPGGSIVVFNYPVTPQSFSNLSSVPSDLVYTTAGFYAQAQPSGAYTPYTIRNPRFLQLAASLTASAPVAAPNPNNVPAFDFLYADDNGAFDLSYDTTKGAFVAGPDRLQYTTSAYQNMSYQTTGISPMTIPVPAFGISNTSTNTGTGAVTYTNLRQYLPFIPTCIQALSTDSQPSGAGSALTTRRYLITQSYSQGELGNVPTTTAGNPPVITTLGKLGGEIFEVDVQANVTTATGAVTGTPTATTPGGFAGNQTLSHPALTGPLTQPTFGIRLP